MGDCGARLLVKVAQMYHVQGLNQDQLGRQLGVSRSKVSRMLKEARESGLVEISIHYPSRFSLDLERRLESEFGLREAVVVNTGGIASIQALRSVAGAAGEYLLRVLRPGDALGVGGGQTVAFSIQVMLARTFEDVSVAPLGTAVTRPAEGGAYTSAEVAVEAAQKLGCIDRLVLVPIPSLLDDETIRDALLRDTGVRQAMAHLAGCTVALVGIGASSTIPHCFGAVGAADARSSQRSHLGLMQVTEDEAGELRRAGAVGEIFGRFFDLAGRPCVTSLDRRMVALDLCQLQAVPLVIGVACGQEKAEAILGAVRGGFVKTLVTDEITAWKMLVLAKSGLEGDTDKDGGRGPTDGGCPTHRHRPCSDHTLAIAGLADN